MIGFLLKFILFFIIALIFVFMIEYLIAPIYVFPDPEPFTGDELFNPYEDIDSNYWRKGNFQIQSEAWGGITDGRKNSNHAIDSIYGLLGYGIIPTSDYQKINRHGSGRATYIPVYEHGYGIRKNHHVMIGAKYVTWNDYPIFQNIHHKQHMVNILRPSTELIFIAHPKLRLGWDPEDMTWLTNYDGIEVLNGYRESVEHWDAALSSGKNMRILANDDAHDISNRNEVGRYCTMIYSPVLHGDSVVEAIKAGRAFGADIFRLWDEPMDEKILKAKSLPKLSNVELKGDTLFVAVNKTAHKFRFIGQEGKVLDSVMHSDTAQYFVKDTDTYVRAEIHFKNRTIYYLNPVIRYDGGDPWEHKIARIDHIRTWIFRIVGFATLIFILMNIYYLRRRIRKRASH
ncbi:MAG: hypothetical protein ABFS05_03260 [Bacteroidota bacterium]